MKGLDVARSELDVVFDELCDEDEDEDVDEEEEEVEEEEDDDEWNSEVFIDDDVAEDDESDRGDSSFAFLKGFFNEPPSAADGKV